MPTKSIPAGSFLKGIVASNSPLSQPKGSIARGSNLVLSPRGALNVCDGSGVINAYSGAVQTNRGRFMSLFLYEPTGVNPYYLAVAQALDQHLGAPKNLTATLASGGTLTSGTTYYYKVTAIDGVGGETPVSNETNATPSGGNLSVKLTWNTVPNAYGYNVYRSTTTNNEILLSGGGLPQLATVPLGATATYTDAGTAGSPSYTISSIIINPRGIMYVTLVAAAMINVLDIVIISGNTNPNANGVFTVYQGTNGGTQFIVSNLTTGGTGSGGTAQDGGTLPPLSDTTQETVLFQMPFGEVPVTYTNSNIVAYFPASLSQLGQQPIGGSGGGGTTGPGIKGRGNSTPSGGVAGLVGPLPQMKQFTNRIMLALGNGFSPQIYWDASGTKVNPAPTGAVASVAVSNDQVTVTAAAAITISGQDPTANGFMPVGSNVILSGMSDSTYNGTFVVIKITAGAGGSFIIRNTSASGGASTGTFTTTTTPLLLANGGSSFTPAYPVWIASTAYAAQDIIIPAHQPGNAIYLTCLQPGTSGASEPGWNSPQPAIGQQFNDNNIIWTVTALLNSAAPPPPGAAHIEVYSGSLWVLNTSPTNTTNGLDGPTALRMSNTNNPFAWNPVNQAFLDKDDGAEGMGLGKFTITALGIPPEGSLIAFKYRVPYQIIGVFGANNFAIQPVSSDQGCLAPRSIVFVPGFGLVRYTHLGIAVFNGIRDEVISEQIRPYLFVSNDFSLSDITVVDANNIPLSWAAQTANPPMYTFLAPIGSSGGQLTRAFLFDLILKAWMIVDFPFSLGCMAQVQPVTSNPLTIIGGFNDGCLSRWQAGDVLWYTGLTVTPSSTIPNVLWSFRTVTNASQDSNQRIYVRALTLVGGATSGAGSSMTVNIRQAGVLVFTRSFAIDVNEDWQTRMDVGAADLRFDADVSGNAHLDVHGLSWETEPRPAEVPSTGI